VFLRREVTEDLLRLYHVAEKGVSTANHEKNLTTLLGKAKAEESQNPSAAGLVGDILVEAGDRPAAIAAFRRALVARPDDSYALRRLAAVETGPARITYLTKLFAAEKNDPTVAFDLITALFAEGNVEGAVQTARQLQSRYSDNMAVLTQLGQLLSKNGRHAEALFITEKIFRSESTHPDAAIAYGDELLALGRPADAAHAYWRIVAQDRSSGAYRQLLEVLSQRRLKVEMRRAFEEALQHLPEDHLLRRDFARWLSETNAVEASLGEWKQLELRAKEPFLRELAQREIKRLEWQKMLSR
jgi:tetratricopeptide (TPR) repeat protein